MSPRDGHSAMEVRQAGRRAPPMAGPPPCSATPDSAPEGFATNEVMAYWTGLAEGPGSLHRGGLRGLFELLFGLRQKRPLANRRLECIRRVTICLNCRLDCLPFEIERALGEGVTSGQIETLKRHIPNRART